MRTASSSFARPIGVIALCIACLAPSAAAVRVAAAPTAQNDAARARLRVMIDDAKSELALAASTRPTLVQSSADAQAQLATAMTQALSAQNASLRLNAAAKALRRQAYAISDLPGLSAEQNHKSVAAMEAADAAEADARVAQFGVTATAAAAVHARGTVDALAAQLAALDARIDACNRLLKLNGAALQISGSGQR